MSRDILLNRCSDRVTRKDEAMEVVDEFALGSESRVSEGGGLPPDRPDSHGDGGSRPENDRLKLLLLIQNARGSRAVSLRYLRFQTGFPRARLWRAFEDLEDVGYIRVSDSDPRGPVTRWLDDRMGSNDRVFASTFVVLTEAGRCELERQVSTPVREGAGSGPRRNGSEPDILRGLRRLAFWRN